MMISRRGSNAVRSRNLLRTGFTILELLVVMGVIAVLFAILMPVIHGIKQKGMAKQAEVESTAFDNALQQFRSEYGYTPGVDVDAGISRDDLIRKYLLSTGAENPHHKPFWEK